MARRRRRGWRDAYFCAAVDMTVSSAFDESDPAPPPEAPLDGALEGPQAALNGSVSHILLADRDHGVRELVQRSLGDGFHVSAVEDGFAALQAALERPPDLVLVDTSLAMLEGGTLRTAL